MFTCETYRKNWPRNDEKCEKQENKENEGEEEEEELKTNRTETTVHCAIAWLTALRYYY